MYLGMQDQYLTFTLFDLEAWYARDVIIGRIALPEREKMREHTAQWVEREEKLADCHEEIDFQIDHAKHLAAEVDYPRFDLDKVAEVFKVWEHDKEVDIVTYRDKSHFDSVITGAKSPQAPAPWWTNKDTSIEGYLGRK